MIDIHSHLLPGVDDGSVSFQQSLEQIRIIFQSGVTRLYLTPHFMRNLYHNTNKVLQPVFEELQEKVKSAKIEIDLKLGCEYFLDNHGAETIKEENLQLGNSNYVLCETMLGQLPPNLIEMIYQIQKAGYKLIFAHPERYTDIIRKPELVEELLHHDIYFQLNAGSLLGMYGRNVEHTVWWLLRNGYAHFMASDNHGNHTGSVQAIAKGVIEQELSSSIAEQLLITNPEKIETGEKIEIFNHWRIREDQSNFWGKLKRFFTGYE